MEELRNEIYSDLKTELASEVTEENDEALSILR